MVLDSEPCAVDNVIAPVRVSEPSFAEVLMVTTPFSSPERGDTVSHGSLLSTVHESFDVIANVFESSPQLVIHESSLISKLGSEPA